MKAVDFACIPVEVLSIEEAEEADRAYWASLSPNERVQKMVELCELWTSTNESDRQPIIEVVEVP